MKKIIFLSLVFAVILAGQCLTPIKSYIGPLIGINYSNLDPKDNAGTLSGTGLQLGLGMGVEMLNTIGIQMAPMFKTTSFRRTILDIPTGANFNNLYLPLSLQLKAGILPLVSPYFGLGIAGNFQLDGTLFVGELETSVDDLENDLYFCISLGSDIKLVKLKITPEFALNYNLTADDPDTQNRTETNYELNFSVGLFYTP
ncbi:MAG: hypothetical protein ACUVQ3_08095 [bacterium]